MAFINLKKLSFKTCLKTCGSYAKQSNCKFICYFNKLISYDFSCIIDGELFAGCLLSCIFHLVPWVKEGKAEPRSDGVTQSVGFLPSLLILLSDGSWNAFQAAFRGCECCRGHWGWSHHLMCCSWHLGSQAGEGVFLSGESFVGHVQHGRFSAASSVTLYL